MLKRLRDSEFANMAQDVRGATLYGINNDKVGSVEDVIFDPDSRTVLYAIVDTGGWLSTRRFLVPSNYIRSSASDPDAFHVPLSKSQIESLPEFNENIVESDRDFSEYESRYRSKWQSYGFAMPESRDPRFSRFEERLRQSRTETQQPTSTTTYTASTHATSGTAPESVYGVFSQRDQLESAVERLKEQGFNSSDISVVFPDKGKTERFAVQHNTKGPEGATVGGSTGMLAGGVLGWLAGIGTLAIPGIGPLLAAGPIVAALAGAGAGGAIGGLAGALIGMGVPELEAKRYEKEIREGRMLLSVRCADPRFVTSARSILQSNHAKDIFQTGEKRAA